MIPIINDLNQVLQLTTPKDEQISLKIYQAPASHWCGILYRNNEEIGRITGCETPADVEDEANNQGFDFIIID